MDRSVGDAYGGAFGYQQGGPVLSVTVLHPHRRGTAAGGAVALSAQDILSERQPINSLALC